MLNLHAFAGLRALCVGASKLKQHGSFFTLQKQEEISSPETDACNNGKR
jgi:hypothetical protein